MVSTFGNTDGAFDGAFDRALPWPEQGRERVLALFTVAPQPLCLMHWHIWSPWEGGARRPLTLTTSLFIPLLPEAVPPGRMPKAEGLDMASSIGNHLRAASPASGLQEPV